MKNKVLIKKCLECGLEKTIDQFPLGYKNSPYSYCKECCSKFNKEQYRLNKNTIRTQQKEYSSRLENKMKRNKRQRERYNNDPIFRIKHRVSRTIRKVFKKQFINKDSPTWTKLPYTPQQLKEHLEKQFEPWMTWENYRSL